MLEADGRPAADDSNLLWTPSTAWRVVWRRRRLAAAIAVEVFVVAALITFLMTPQYRASAHLLIERATPNVLESDDVVPVVWNEFEIRKFYETQYTLLSDPVVLKAALDRHGVRDALSNTLQPEPEQDGEPPPDDEKLCRWLGSRLRIAQRKQSNVIEVSFLHPSPHVAANVVNAVVESYRDLFVTSGIESRRVASEFLNERIEEAQADVLALQRLLARQRNEKGAAIPAGSAEMGKVRLSSLDETLTQAKTRRAAAEARVAALVAADPLDLSEIRENPRVSWYFEELAGLQKERSELEKRFGPAWPRLVELNEAVEEVNAQLSQELTALHEQSLGSARVSLRLARQEEGRLSALLDSELSSASRDEINAADHEALRTQYEQKRAALGRLLQRREDVALSVDLENILKRQVTVLDSATPPKERDRPKIAQNLLLGLLFGLLSGVAATFVAESLDNKIRSSKQLEAIGGLPLLGVVPRVARRGGPRLIYSRRRPDPGPSLLEGRRELDEAFRALRSTLMLAQAGGPPRSLLVTSALPGEGKSTVTSRLAQTLASFGQRTVVVDADLRRPQLHRVFRVSNDVGLTNVLASSDLDCDAVLCQTRYENLYLLPGGPRPPDPATLLDGRRLTALLERLTTTLGFQFVLIDTPPVLVFSDVLSIAPVVERSIVVARSMQTPKDAFRQAIDALRKVNAPVAGAVLNGAIADQRSAAYYRSYYHEKGGSRSAPAKRPSRAPAAGGGKKAAG